MVCSRPSVSMLSAAFSSACSTSLWLRSRVWDVVHDEDENQEEEKEEEEEEEEDDEDDDAAKSLALPASLHPPQLSMMVWSASTIHACPAACHSRRLGWSGVTHNKKKCA